MGLEGGGEEAKKGRTNNRGKNAVSLSSSSTMLTFRQGLGEARQGLVREVGIPGVEGLGEGGGAGAEGSGGGEEEQGHGDDGCQKEGGGGGGGGGARRRHSC